MRSAYRGFLALVGIVTGFLTLVFVSQTLRYLNLALTGDQLSLGMFGLYVVLTYLGGSVTVVSFLPKSKVGKYMGGVGAGVVGFLVLLSLYLFTTGDIASGMMILIIAGGQAAIAGVVYGVSRVRSNNGESD